MNCPCGTELPIADCCGRFHSGDAVPDSPEQLMRSRYAAFCLRDSDYLIESHHSSQHLPDDREHLTRTMDATKWLELRILETEMDGDDRAIVEFVAFYQHTDDPDAKDREQLHERSNFVKDNGRWYYVDGEMLPPLAFP